MTTDRLIGILGLLLGLPAFFELLFSSEHRVEGALVAVPVVLVLCGYWWYRRQESQPQFSSLELRKTFRITALDGSTATYERFERLRANRKGIQEWWSRGMTQDGSIRNIRIDLRVPDMTEINAGATDVGKRFDRALEKGEELVVSLTYDLEDAFLRENESVIHDNASDVDELVIIIELPRPCIKAEVQQTYSGDHGKLLANPALTLNNHRIEAKIKKPRLGASYHVDWTW